MIRFATKNDLNGIISLWNEAFGDSEEDIMFFLDNRFIPENTLVYEYCGEVVSMLFLLEGNMVINGAVYPSYYLYAACTAKKCRGRGIMAELLEKAKSVGAERDRFFICLMPGEKSLFEFYERFGYKTVFSRKILKVNLSDLSKKEKSINNLFFCDYYSKRKNAFSDYNRFEWDNNAIEFACKSNLLYNGIERNNCKGYALYMIDLSDLYVKEFAFNKSDFNDELNSLLLESNCKNAVLFLPSEYPTDIGELKIEPSAMAVAVKPEFDSLISELTDAYLGLTLD